MTYIAYILGLWACLAAAAVWVSVMAEDAGYMSVLHAGLLGVGAYTSTITMDHGASWWAAIGLAMCLSAAVGLVLWGAMLVVRDHLFALATLIGQVVLSTLALRLDDYTGGSSGLAVPTIASDNHTRVLVTTGGSVLALGLSLSAAHLLRQSRSGLVLRVGRVDDALLRSLRISPRPARLLFCVASSMIVGMLGVIMAQLVGAVAPSQFDLDDSIILLGLALLHRVGGFAIVLVGTAIVTALPELLRSLDALGLSAGAAQQALVGLALVAVAGRRGKELEP